MVFIGIGGKSFASMPVVEKDQEKDLVKIKCTIKSSNGSGHPNTELSDTPTTQHHNGPSEPKTVPSLAPVHIPRSGSCPSKIPLPTHRDVRSRSKTLNPTMTATDDDPASRMQQPISTANPKSLEKTSNVIPSTAKPVGTRETHTSTTTTDGPFSEILQPALPATSESQNEIPSTTKPTGQSKTHASKRARGSSVSGISQPNSTANSDPADEMLDERSLTKATGPSPSDQQLLSLNPPKSSSSEKPPRTSKIPVRSSSKKKLGEHARSS